MVSRILLVIAGILGIGLGVWTAHWRVRSMPWDGTAEGTKAYRTPSPPAPATPAENPNRTAKVVVEKDTYDFGTMDAGSEASHEFIFKNEGDAPLTLTKGRSTCKCTVANLQQAQVAPGQSTKVKLDWKAKGFVGAYQQSAVILTNDPHTSTVTLSVSGRIVTTVKVVPDELVLSSVTAGENASGTVAVYGCVPEPLKVTGQELVDANIARYFDVKCAPMKPNEVAKEKDAKSGVSLEVGVKPGLPIGAFKQTIRLKTSLAAASTVDVAVKGKIVSDIEVVGAGWDDKYSVLAVGSVSNQEEVARTLFVMSRGPDRDKVKLKVADVWPAFLKPEIGPTSEVSVGGLRRTTVVIRIPKGSPPANHLGAENSKCGRILLETGHPRAPKLLIRVQFAVEG